MTTLPLIELIEYVQKVKIQMSTKDLNKNANLLFSVCLLFALIYFVFYHISQVGHLSYRISFIM